MKKIKIKTKQEDRSVEVSFYDGKEKIGNTTKYVNSCIVCKKVTIDDKDLGEKYICPECVELLKPRKKVKEQQKKEIVKRNYVLSINDISKNYQSSIKVVDLVDYQNLMEQKLNEHTITMIIDLILKGCNTVDKIAKKLGITNKDTLYAYMQKMSQVAMLYKVNPRGNKATLYNYIYKINPNLTYTII